MIQTAILGYGNIGSGVMTVLESQKNSIVRETGQEISVKYVLDLKDFPGDPAEEKLVHDVSVILDDPEVSIVVETMGGLHPAYDYVKRALKAGKHVVTSNKEMVAAYGEDLLLAASENQVSFLFEASVGGGIPIIRPLNTSLATDTIWRISGVLNGTTNYMLTKMAEGMTKEEALADAARRGFAEKNSDDDLKGFDSMRKIAILCSMVFGTTVHTQDVSTKGLEEVSDVELRYASRIGKTVRLLAQGEKKADGIRAFVAPVMMGSDHPLAVATGVMNAILVEAETSGPLLFYGAGAGKLPTAGAVVSDIVDIAKHPHGTLLHGWRSAEESALSEKEEEQTFFVRFAGGKEKEEEIGRRLLVRQWIGDVREGEFAVVTEKMTDSALTEILDRTAGVISRLLIVT